MKNKNNKKKEYHDKCKKKSRFKLVLGIATIVLFFLIYKSYDSKRNLALKNLNEVVTIYRTPTCDCCRIHEEYFSQKSGLKVKSIILNDISHIKREFGIPKHLQSCHTMIIGKYFVEGHVPVEAINKLIEKRPNISGIALPNMPSGSPGMPGRKLGPFRIYGIEKNGNYQNFMSI